MEKGICYVVGAGESYGLDFVPRSNDFVIAADAGFWTLEQHGISVDLAIGDFDTLHLIPSHPRVIVLNADKNDTDMRAAVHEGIKAGYEVFHIYCGTGGRIDHTIANMQLLAELSQRGKWGFLFGKDEIITAITDRTMTFPDDSSGYLSVFSYSPKAEGVFLKGLKYELDNVVLTNTFPLGVSNEFIGEASRITVKNGTLLIVFPLEARAAAYSCGQ